MLGAHVWLFFEEAVPAALARKLGSHIITVRDAAPQTSAGRECCDGRRQRRR